MTKFNPKNERIKKAYYTYLKEADQKAETTIDGSVIAGFCKELGIQSPF